MEIKNIELQSSRDGYCVPVINGIYLHSIYNPIKEAETFAQNNSNALASKNNILILGLGFGYHIEEVAKLTAQYHQKYKIIVIEPNQDLVNLFKSNRSFSDKNIEIISSNNVEDIYSIVSFAKLLISKPAILKLDTSFNINKEFFTNFLTYKSSTSSADYRNRFSDEAIKLWGDYEGSFHERVKNIKNQRTVQRKEDFLILALSEIARNNKEVSQ